MADIKQITWDDLSISQVVSIEKILNSKGRSIDKSLDILSVIYRKDRKWFEEEIDATELHNYLIVLTGLLETPVDLNFDKFAEYEIWGEKWELCISPKQMETGQYISLNAVQEEQPNNIGLLLAMLLTPKKGEFGVMASGKKYDPDDLAKHLNETFPFTKARAIANFFWQASLTSKMLTLRSTRKRLMALAKKEKEKTRREAIKESIRKINQAIVMMKEEAKVAI